MAVAKAVVNEAFIMMFREIFVKDRIILNSV